MNVPNYEPPAGTKELIARAVVGDEAFALKTCSVGPCPCSQIKVMKLK